MPQYEDYPSPATEPFDSFSEYGHAAAPSDLHSPHSSFEVDSPGKRGLTKKTTTGKQERKDGDTPAPAPAPSHVLRAGRHGLEHSGMLCAWYLEGMAR